MLDRNRSSTISLDIYYLDSASIKHTGPPMLNRKWITATRTIHQADIFRRQLYAAFVMLDRKPYTWAN